MCTPLDPPMSSNRCHNEVPKSLGHQCIDKWPALVLALITYHQRRNCLAQNKRLIYQLLHMQELVRSPELAVDLKNPLVISYIAWALYTSKAAMTSVEIRRAPVCKYSIARSAASCASQLDPATQSSTTRQK